MILQPYKFQIVATCQYVDDDGNVAAEETVSFKDGPIVLFGMNALREFADTFEEKLNDRPTE